MAGRLPLVFRGSGNLGKRWEKVSPSGESQLPGERGTSGCTGSVIFCRLLVKWNGTQYHDKRTGQLLVVPLAISSTLALKRDLWGVGAVLG